MKGMGVGMAAVATGAMPAFAAGAGAVLMERPATPDAALQRLMAGNRRFVAGQVDSPRRSIARVRETAEGQAPYAAILGCADSRVPPELVFDEGFGDLFVNRVAGNLATAEDIASLEFGVAVLGTQVLLVLGHTECGAVKAAVAGTNAPGQITALYRHMYVPVMAAGGDVNKAVALNAAHQRDVLRGSSVVLRDAIKAGKLRVEAGVYDLATGRVTLLDVPLGS